MIYVALGALAVLAFTVYGSAALVRGIVRQQARERELLLNQIMHLSGRTWQPPPVSTDYEGETAELTVIDPTQLPDY